MDWQMKENVESLMSVKTKDLKNCTKEMVVEFHNKTIYDCQNVTKRHCTTLWTINEQGQKVWAGNEDDCRDVTWEECSPVEKRVPMSVAQMVCLDVPVGGEGSYHVLPARSATLTTRTRQACRWRTRWTAPWRRGRSASR